MGGYSRSRAASSSGGSNGGSSESIRGQTITVLVPYNMPQRLLNQFTADGLGTLPICMAKTHLSLSPDAELLNAPEGFTLPVRDVRAYTGAGWIVPLCGTITQMPGLGKESAAVQVDITETGRTVGLF